MASITKRGPAQWQAKVRRTGFPARSKTFETFEAAKAWADVLEGKISGDEYVDKSREKALTLRDLIERYLLEVTPKKASAHTERPLLNKWLAEPFADWSLVSVQPSDFVEWRERRHNIDKAAPTTINNAMNTLSNAFKIARAEWGWNIDNPLSGIRRIEQNEPRWVELTSEDEQKLLEECSLPRHPAWLFWETRIAIETAMRQSEIRALRWEHIFPAYIHVPKMKSNRKGRAAGGATKRDVPLTSKGRELIAQLRASPLPRRLDGFVFGDPTVASATEGGHTKDQVSRAFRRAARFAEINLTFHDLRHVAITRLAPLHRDALDLAKTTGHKNSHVLQRYYNPSTDDRIKEILWREQQIANGALI
ncbi:MULTISPECIES: tyrosine-type recombinase/integrase [Thalassospira]|uniref:tyrosine-type recombinase/integrase n=1 Tax=Thalassospira TaxID=168934 RepID=UPI0008DDFCF1|nr:MULTISPECIES: tyrosine-type recombinase/integrase [Thalassospira]MDM7975405.1 tyrosine-type recombinase/integrase [Thalassospira xiamenensis]OHZ00826.1 hypothetical protein BC440_08200 [Thalassospira sp. MIT1004]